MAIWLVPSRMLGFLIWPLLIVGEIMHLELPDEALDDQGYINLQKAGDVGE